MFVVVTLSFILTLIVGTLICYFQIGVEEEHKVKGEYSFTFVDFAPAVILAFAVLLVLTVLRVGIINGATSDLMTINSVVAKKYKDTVSCGHSYQCNCTTTYNASTKSSSTSCQTCYEHSEDYDWVVKSDIGKTYIDRIDRQGEDTPPRWESAIVGEPYSTQISHTNYIKSSPMSIFKDFEQFEKVDIPSRPDVYDYYRIKHTVNFNSSWTKEIDQIDKLLGETLAKTSPIVKANVVVVFYGGDDKVLQAMKVRTFGGRINDQTIMVKVDPDGKIVNVFPFSWTLNNMVNVKLRDDIMALGNLNGKSKEFVDAINSNMKAYYAKRPNNSHDYLRYNIEYRTWFYVMCLIFPILAIAGLIVFNRQSR